MKQLIVFSVFCISAVWLLPTNPIDGPVVLADSDSRIINGQNAAKGQFPWHAAIFYNASGSQVLCGGSLIGQQWILTAGHCVAGVTRFQVQLGSNTLVSADANRVTVISTTSYLHPNFSASARANDVGLIKIPSVTLNTYIKTIPIWTNVLQSNVAVTVSGFGKLSDTSGISNQLKYVTLTTITNTVCTLTFGSIIKSYMFCAIGFNLQNVCGGDSGGPVIVTVGGVTSHVGMPSLISSAGCQAGLPSAFTRSRDYRAWIKSVTGLNV